ncbi:MAG: ATP-binding protein [Actinomycetota bacterium]|nr:ATP-binding protein [Actinomycetota bacterium]
MVDNTKKDLLGRIDEGVERLTRLVGELLYVSRIEGGHLVLNRRKIELKSLLERAIETMRKRGIEKDIVIRIPDRMSRILVDPLRIIVLFTILFDNACRYFPEVWAIEVTADTEENNVVVSVVDRGIGIPKKDNENVFKRVYHVEETRHHSISGIGL